MDKQQYLEVYRHSLAHILAKAVIEIYGKDVQYAIGPQIDDGAYYDFVLPEGQSISENDFAAIENKMHEILKRKEAWTRKEVSRAEALELFKDQKFKTELIEDLPEDEKITVYYTGDDYIDLCRGPHVDNSQELLGAAFKIHAASMAYWRGDEKRDRMQRVYFYAYPTKAELKDHIKMIQEAKDRSRHALLAAQRLADVPHADAVQPAAAEKARLPRDCCPSDQQQASVAGQRPLGSLSQQHVYRSRRGRFYEG